jgi:hypothetical protein
VCNRLFFVFMPVYGAGPQRKRDKNLSQLEGGRCPAQLGRAHDSWLDRRHH